VGKYVLSILGLISLIWIGYVGLNLTSLGNNISPETTFGKADSSVVVVHKPMEIDYQEPALGFLPENDFYTQVLTHTERIQHFYFSSSRPLLLLERSKPWTIEIINRYFASMGVDATFKSAKSFRLSNGWNATYDKEYLLVSRLSEVPETDSDIDWKYVDRRSSASILQRVNGVLLIENAYRNNASQISYISQSTASNQSLADDQDIFQDIIPAKFTEYEFFGKEYLRSISPSSSESLFEWMSTGAVLIRYNGKKCIVTDCIPGQDPIAILGNQVDESSISEEQNSAFVRATPLPKRLLRSDDWYIEVFNNRVFIAAEKGTIDDLIGAYETGATLSQNEALRSSLFLKAPKRVSYRKISPAEHRTISLLDHSRHTVVQRLGGEEEPESGETAEQVPDEKPASTIRIEGGIAQLIPVQGTNFLYAISKSNMVYGIQGDQERWKITLPAAMIGRAALSYSKNELIVTTATAIHQLTKGGKDQALAINSTPITPAVSFSWKGAQLLAVLSAQQLQVFNPTGTVKNTIALPFTPRETEFVIWSNAGELTATMAGKTKGVNLPVERKKKGKEFELPAVDLTAIKTDAGPLFCGIRNKRLISVTHKGIISELFNRNADQLLPIEETGSTTYLKVKAGRALYILATDGRQIAYVKPDFGDLADCSYQLTASGKSVIGILDGIANKNYIYGLNGKQLTSGSFDGSSILMLHRIQNGTLLLISQSNDYLLRYPI
jgi:hypothetical protein